MLPNIDLAIECSELRGRPEGMAVKTENCESGKLTEITVSTPEAAASLGKPVGSYITLEFASAPTDSAELISTATKLAEKLKTLLPPEGELLFCGLGNSRMTSDSLGPRAARQVLATRHIPKDTAGLPPLRPVSAFAPGVLSQTGVESAELVAGLAARLKPAAVITADSLAARRLARLGKTVQIADSGISPGSGVGNDRARLDAQTLGCKVISVGVPLVVDGLTLALDLMQIDQQRREEYAALLPEAEKLIVTPGDIDAAADSLARLIALTFNLAAQPGLDPEFLLSAV